MSHLKDFRIQVTMTLELQAATLEDALDIVKNLQYDSITRSYKVRGGQFTDYLAFIDDVENVVVC